MYPTVHLLDVSGALVTDQDANVTLTLENAEEGTSSPAASMPLSHAVQLSTLGVASFGGAKPAVAARSVVLRASSSGLVDAVSSAFDVVSPGAVVAVSMFGAPEHRAVQTGSSLAASIGVELVDANFDRVDATTRIVCLCLRRLGHESSAHACTTGSPALISAGSAFHGFPGAFNR